jgi:threonine-phosphate decarboxylase
LVRELSDYPDPEAGDLKCKLASNYQLSVNEVWVTNGSIEGIYMLAQVFAGKKSGIIFPCFSEYEDACQRYKHELSFYSNQGKWYNEQFTEELIWFGNPNNPDGKTISVAQIENMLSRNMNTIFIIDEAYADLCPDFGSALPLLRSYSNLILIRSFTKAFAIPGIRLGYVLASENIIQQLANYSIPWSVNHLAIEAGKYILDHQHDCLPDLSRVQKETKAFQMRLAELPGVRVHVSLCNYFLIELSGLKSNCLKSGLVEKFGILVRDAYNFRGLNHCFIRLSLQSDADCNLIVNTLKEMLNE